MHATGVCVQSDQLHADTHCAVACMGTNGCIAQCTKIVFIARAGFPRTEIYNSLLCSRGWQMAGRWPSGRQLSWPSGRLASSMNSCTSGSTCTFRLLRVFSHGRGAVQFTVACKLVLRSQLRTAHHKIHMHHRPKKGYVLKFN